MKILITGDKGFIGRHLRQSLISDGHIVLGIDINNVGSKYSFYNHSNGCYYFEEDCDAYKLCEELKAKGYSIKYNYHHVGINFLNSPNFKRLDN